VGLFIGVCRKVVRIQDPVRAVKKLGGFEDHLDDMLVAVELGGFPGIE
jgi:hypothetical protein